ncbi:MAG: 2-isopropylmalate synthase [Lachnospiraceae bacterium]|nr:2-isopropylmalate synthase [Lachnospiraceae bacterium]
MMDATKYKRNYFMPPEESLEWTKKEYIDKAPAWCSVDLRDGNQALIVPMSLEDKIEFFKMLVAVGFKEIEVGFPAASETEYEFLRALIDRSLIPDDVTIQVLTQARPHIIQKTFEAVRGCKHAVIHLYNSTSLAQREQVFKKSKEEIIEIAVEGAKMLLDLTKQDGGNYQFEYSPESFTGTEVDFALEICNAVIDIWKPTPDNKVIINLPATVEMSSPHVYASQIEYMSKHLSMRENVILSLHPHNDRGCGVADAELGVLAGADRIEGTLFGNGERTGNVDIITLAMNMYTHGVDPKLDFSDIPKITELYEQVTGMHVYERSPYTGKLVFAAFSGSHQDAIAKGMHWREEKNLKDWTVPYLPLDPHDVGREYDGDVIRINSQSGKGGIGYILEQRYGFNLPAKMREDLGYAVKNVSDHMHKELSPEEILGIYNKEYVNIKTAIKLDECHFVQEGNGVFSTAITIKRDGTPKIYHGTGNGRLDAVANAVKKHFHVEFKLICYEEHALQHGSNSQACAYVGIEAPEGVVTWGCGIKNDIIDASVCALLSAVNKVLDKKNIK